MTDIEILKTMIRRESTINLDDSDQKKLVLEESSAKCRVKVSGMPDEDQVIVIRTDCFDAPKSIFANTQHECKRADFVIIAETESGKFIIIIEMKSGKGESGEIIQQLKGSQCLVAYFREVGKVFWEQQDFLDHCIYKFVSVKNINIPKRPTRPSQSDYKNDRPDRMMKITGKQKIYFKELLGARKK